MDDTRPKTPAHFGATLALTVGGLGFIKPAPGTWGSIPPVAVAMALVETGRAPGVTFAVIIAMAAFFSIACVVLGRYAEQRFGRKDASEVVADESAGVCIPIFIALGFGGHFGLLVGAFVLFRVFDVWKPSPMRRLEALPGGWGVLLDDLMAGLYAAAVLWLIAQGWSRLAPA